MLPAALPAGGAGPEVGPGQGCPAPVSRASPWLRGTLDRRSLKGAPVSDMPPPHQDEVYSAR